MTFGFRQQIHSLGFSPASLEVLPEAARRRPTPTPATCKATIKQVTGSSRHLFFFDFWAILKRETMWNKVKHVPLFCSRKGTDLQDFRSTDEAGSPLPDWKGELLEVVIWSIMVELILALYNLSLHISCKFMLFGWCPQKGPWVFDLSLASSYFNWPV